MSDVVVSVVESNTAVTVTEQDVAVDVTENNVVVSVSTAGIQGVPGANNDPTYVTVRNATGATLAKGTIVYISGANGNNVQVSKAIATGDSTSARTIGWLAVDIPNNGSGLCMVEGYLEGLNTQGFTAGAQLYLSGTIAGGFTQTKPQAPIHLVYVGVVTKVSAGDGHVFVKVQNGYELGELHDVLIVSPTNNQVLAYDSATQLWKNATNAPDGVTSITATAPLTGGTITSTGSIGLNQALLSITKSQVSDFTSGTVTSASTAQQAGTAVYATTSGTAVSISGTITKSQVSDFTSGTVASAGTSQQSGTAVFANTSGTATYATTSGTATYADTSGTAVFATNASTAVTISGSIAQSQVTNLTTDLANTAKLNTANTFSVGGHLINNSGTAVVPLILRGASGQSADLFEIQNSSSTDLGYFTATGDLWVTGAVRSLFYTNKNNTGGYLNYSTDSPMFEQRIAGQVGLRVRGAASQSVDLFQVQNSAGTNLVRADQFGGLFSTYATFTSDAAGTRPLLVRGASGQTANLFEIQTSGASTLFRVDSAGSVFTGAQSITIPGTVGTNALRMRSTTDGVGNLVNLRFESSNGNLFDMGKNEVSSQQGSFYLYTGSALPIELYNSATKRLIIESTGNVNIGPNTGSGFARLTVFNDTATRIGMAVRGAASQTANLTEWQNSAGTVLARVESTGAAMFGNGNMSVSSVGSIFANTVNTNVGRIGMSEANSGGQLTVTRQTAAATNPGANIARLYFRDGTNAGTLKLVVRAGAAGAETTILDNIPQ